ncbi:DUF58 domain-containing protein [Cellulomonas soli]
MGLRPTSRGIGLLLAGAGLVMLGVALGTVDVVRMGTLAVLAVLVPTAVLAVLDPGRGRHRLTVSRTTTPNPVHVGDRADVQVHIGASDPAGRVRLAGLRFAEQAATDLSGGGPLRARVRRSPQQVTVSYTVQAGRRGRWPLGPLVVTRHDPFGVARSSATLGGSAEVEVWPRVVPLPAPSSVLVGEPERVALGARTPSTDDASLREYHEGDDLRRVHWRSSARRGSLMVRSDERAGMRPVSVLLDLPARSEDLEWTISLAASMALAMLEGGHPVRLVGGTRPPDAPGIGDAAAWVHPTGEHARGTLLDRTIDLEEPRSPEVAATDLLAAAHLLESSGAGDDIVLATVGPLDPSGRAALAHLADSVQGWAVVRRPAHARGAHDAEATVRTLRRAGWRACEVTTGEDLVTCWLRLLGSLR